MCDMTRLFAWQTPWRDVRSEHSEVLQCYMLQMQRMEHSSPEQNMQGAHQAHQA